MRENFSNNMLFPKSALPKMPASDWKKCLLPSKLQEMQNTPKKSKPIPKISEKKKKRLKENGSESDLFRKIWEERPHYCEICGTMIPEPKPESFSHRLSKGRYPALRYNPKNITLVCSMACHSENDSRNAWNDLQLIQEITWNSQ